MDIVVIGMNQMTADLEVRNKLIFHESRKIEFINLVLDLGISECVVISTCSRHEIYLSDLHETSVEEVILLLESYFGVLGLSTHLYIKKNEQAIAHLFKVTAGLNSIVIGEDQILGQVKEAHLTSMEMGATRKSFNRLFRDAITASKQIKSELKISELPLSLAYIGVKTVCEFLPLSSSSVMLIGTGEMGSLALKYIMEHNPKRVLLANRTKAKSTVFKETYEKIEIIDYDNRMTYYPDVDLIISATSSPHHIIKHGEIHHKMTILDLAMPQDVAPEVHECPLIQVINIDSLHKISMKNQKRRMDLQEEANVIVEDKIQEYLDWHKTIKVDPIIEELNNFRVTVERDTLEYLQRRLMLDCRDKKVLNKIISSSLKRMVRNPILKLKSLNAGEIDDYIDAVKGLYEI
jgi:glutamyl-tRNA reductase